MTTTNRRPSLGRLYRDLAGAEQAEQIKSRFPEGTPWINTPKES